MKYFWFPQKEADVIFFTRFRTFIFLFQIISNYGTSKREQNQVSASFFVSGEAFSLIWVKSRGFTLCYCCNDSEAASWAFCTLSLLCYIESQFIPSCLGQRQVYRVTWLELIKKALKEPFGKRELLPVIMTTPTIISFTKTETDPEKCQNECSTIATWNIWHWTPFCPSKR